MEKTYIVRIYQHFPQKPKSLIGTIEEAGVKGIKTFHTVDEMVSILSEKDLDSIFRKRE